MPVATGGDGGMLGSRSIRFPPALPYVYLSLTVGGTLEVQRWRLSGGALTFETVVITGIAGNDTKHGSGRVRFRPDGAL